MNRFMFCVLMIAPQILADSLKTGNSRILFTPCFVQCHNKFMCKRIGFFSNPRCISSDRVCDGFMDCVDGSDETDCRKEFKCEREQYKCEGQDTCIDLEQICDGEKDCGQGEDEAKCQFKCPEHHYKCEGDDRCIHVKQICDGENDCYQGDDEASCLPRCPVGEYLCTDGKKCLSASMVCDGNVDCAEGDDESQCLPRCPVGEYSCADGKRCLFQSMVCDGKEDCEGGDDEAVCLPRCPMGEYSCATEEKCLSQSMVCDETEDCDGGDDEAECLPRCPMGEYSCATEEKCLSQSMVCDENEDCDGGDDEAECLPRCPMGEYSCATEEKCLSQSMVCDETEDCDGGDDEAECLPRCPMGEYSCATEEKCLSQSMVCDETEDCDGGDDEAECLPRCPMGEYSCATEEKCLSQSMMCDETEDCDGGDDEAKCLPRCPMGEYSCATEEKCLSQSMVCDETEDCDGGDDEAECLPRCPMGEYSCATEEKCLSQSMVCDETEDCDGGDDEAECLPRCPMGEYSCATEEKCLSQSMVCDETEDCDGGDDEAECPCEADQFTCSDRSCIDQNDVCNRDDDCPDSDDELSCPSCGDTWNMTASFSNTGAVTGGSKEDLITKVLAGHDVRLFMPNINYLTSVQNAHTIGDNICAQAIFHISKSNYRRFQSDAYWWLLNVCTTGQVHIKRYRVGSNSLVRTSTVRWPTQWVVRSFHYTPLYTNGDLVMVGSLNNLIANVKAGHDVRIVDDCEGYVAPIDSVKIPPTEDFAVAQAVYHVSQREIPPNWVFQGNDFWRFSNRITDGTSKFTSYTIGLNENRGDDETKRQMAWHTESCWKQTYKHDADGKQLEGTLQDLFDAIEEGHRVKIIYDDIVSVEPDELILRGGHVNALVLRMIKNDPADIKSFVIGAQRKFRLQSTTGKVETVTVNVGEYAGEDRSIGTASCTWFTDVRQWNLKLVNDGTGVVQDGSRSDLTDAVRGGARIRYFLTDGTNNVMIHEADNVAISGNEVGAMHVWSVGLVETMNSVTEMSFPLGNLFYVFRIASTTAGEVAMTKWTVGDNVNRGRSITRATMAWFADI